MAERLGYPADAKLLIVHADDLGMAHSVNAATIKAFETGLVNSGSVMVSCPWFPEIAAYSLSTRSRPRLHLTLTSEGDRTAGGPSYRRIACPPCGAPTATSTGRRARRPRALTRVHVEAEIRAQIERARAFACGLRTSTSHMGTLSQNERFSASSSACPREQVAGEDFKRLAGEGPLSPPAWADNIVMTDHRRSIPTCPRGLGRLLRRGDQSIRPGVTEIVIHLAYDDAEWCGHSQTLGWGAGWRQRDFDFFTTTPSAALLREHNVRLITWAEVGKLIARHSVEGGRRVGGRRPTTHAPDRDSVRFIETCAVSRLCGR